ncbi:hypothetical protein PR048_026547 [Dryococelus australis]|uniref:Integrase catalytic domain-containing protein n=1 Tax=Dryococelus australis TaxID=614101 RepID=A0ABQ9GLN5_9NEOP|nr:hypothetical protein PR048_026547 [Dryococelus australis]
MKLFLKNASKSENHRGGNLVVEEIEEPERRLLRIVQREEAEEIDGKWMKSLCIFVDPNGLIRMRIFESRKITTNPSPLPEDRLNDALVFEVCGVDMAGPLYLKGGEKAWILLFTGTVYWAVHFELVLSLYTGVFHQGLRRFIACWGRPRVMYIDNGTNIIGTDNGFDSLDWSEIE